MGRLFCSDLQKLKDAYATLDNLTIFNGFSQSKCRADAWIALDIIKEDPMARLTKDQVTFAKSMSNKQRAVLRTLAENFPFYMSASERCDPELDDLFRNKLVKAYLYGIDDGVTRALPSWDVTQAGKLVASKLKSGTL